jgi:hypothetical protein
MHKAQGEGIALPFCIPIAVYRSVQIGATGPKLLCHCEEAKLTWQSPGTGQVEKKLK